MHTVSYAEPFCFRPSDANEYLNNSSLSQQDCNEGALCVQLGTNASDDDEEFFYPEISAKSENICLTSPNRQSHPSPTELESLCTAASSGDLLYLKQLFMTAVESGEIEPFTLANHASIRTGFTVLHVAASKGHHDIVVWCKCFGPSKVSLLSTFNWFSDF